MSESAQSQGLTTVRLVEAIGLTILTGVGSTAIVLYLGNKIRDSASGRHQYANVQAQLQATSNPTERARLNAQARNLHDQYRAEERSAAQAARANHVPRWGIAALRSIFDFLGSHFTAEALGAVEHDMESNPSEASVGGDRQSYAMAPQENRGSRVTVASSATGSSYHSAVSAAAASVSVPAPTVPPTHVRNHPSHGHNEGNHKF